MKTTHVPCYMLGRSRNRRFVGQHNILYLIDVAFKPKDSTKPEEPAKFDESEECLRAFAICGIGGLGKTEIAAEYMHLHRSQFDTVFWVNAASIEHLDSCFRSMAIRLGLCKDQMAVCSNTFACRNAVKEWLSNPVKVSGEEQDSDAKARWLLVFDNADDPNILHDFWPTKGPGYVLITSRSPMAKQATPEFVDISGVDVPPMPPEQAGSWLQRLAEREKDPSGLPVAKKIAKMMGGLPVAIVQMAYLIRAKHLSLTEFLVSYEHNPRKFLKAPFKGVSQQHAIASMWKFESLSRSALALLGVLSVLNHDKISEMLLTEGADKVELNDYPREQIAYMEAREELCKTYLVTRSTELDYLQVHRLVQANVREAVHITDLRSGFDAAVCLLFAIWPFINETNEYNVERLRQVEYYLPHIEALRQVITVKSAEKLKPNVAVAALFNETAW